MIEYAKVNLWSASFWKEYFKQELIKNIEKSDKQEFYALKKYCFDKYYDMHPDVLDEVFSLNYEGNSRMVS